MPLSTYSDLEATYPLPSGWTRPDRFHEKVFVANSRIDLFGVSVRGPGGEVVTGSAACSDASDSAAARSYFELVERVSVLNAMRSEDQFFELLDRLGRPAGHAPRIEVFPESPAPDRWRPSRSNGVALQQTWEKACDRAAAELIERDRVLRSWYGESNPRRISLPESTVPDGLRTLARWTAYEMIPAADAVGTGITAVAVVGTPHAELTPFAYGFAARTTVVEATRAAAAEAVQRFGFLVGEDVPRTAPSISATPDFHQEFFLYPPSQSLLHAWLDSGRVEQPSSPTAGQRTMNTEIRFVDLTPPHLRGALFVAKALCAAAEPLVFGEPAPHRADTPTVRRVHPIA